MNENCILDKLLNSCDQLIYNLTDENIKLNQELQEMCSNSNVNTDNNINGNNVYGSYPTPIEAPMDIDENILNNLLSYNKIPDNNKSLKAMTFNSSTFNPITVSNSITENTNISSEILNEEVLTMILANTFENAPLGNVCNEIDFDNLNQDLLAMQENTVNSTVSIDTSVESIIEEIKNNNTSLLESTYYGKNV